MKLFVKNVENLVLPKKGNESDGAYDVIATSGPNIVGTRYKDSILWTSVDYIEYGTNLFVSHAPLEDDHFAVHRYPYLDIRPRSSISKYNLVLANSLGLIDNGYRNEIKVRFKYIFQPIDFVLDEGKILGAVILANSIYKKGDKIVQAQLRLPLPIEFELVNELPESDRGLGGFGSTGN